MIELNLTTSNKEQEIIKQFLQENASEVLADKINNGVKIVKDNVNLINKKDLNGFMKYASREAKKLAEKGSNCACIEDRVVFGWAIHYFEEDSIEGTLYNEGGTEYKPATKKTETPKVESKPIQKKPEKQQATLFDLFSTSTETNNEIKKQDELFEEEKEPPIDTLSSEEKQVLNDIFDDEFETTPTNKENTVKEYYKIYHEQELTYPDIVVLTKVGDFYEAYNENAKRIANILNLILTSRDVGLKNKVALAGFPVHVKEKYLEKLQKFYTVLIIENDEINFYEKTEEKPLLQSETPTIDKDYMKMLYTILDGKITIK